MTKAKAYKIIDKVLAYARADAVTVSLSGGEGNTTRLADNIITQNVQGDWLHLGVGCAYGKSQGAATTSDASDSSIKAVVERAQAIARVSPPDPEYMPPIGAAEAKKYLKVKGHYKATVDYTPLAKARHLAVAAREVAGKKMRLSGAYGTGGGFLAVGNSAGLRAYHESTSADAHMTVLGREGTGWAQQVASSSDDISVKQVVAEAAQIAAEAQKPSNAAAGKYTVIMRPAAVAEMLAFLFWGGFDAKATDEGRTFLRGKLGRKVCGANVTVRSDAAEARCPGSPFQWDGLANRPLYWIRKGVVENLKYSRYWAKRKKKQTTGWPANIIMEGADTRLEEMIASTKKGILVTRFWYIRFVDPMVPSVTGMTRDGLFLVENGKVSKPVRQMRFNENLVDMLNRVEMVGEAQRTGEWMGMLVPALKVRDFNFTSTTKF